MFATCCKCANHSAREKCWSEITKEETKGERLPVDFCTASRSIIKIYSWRHLKMIYIIQSHREKETRSRCSRVLDISDHRSDWVLSSFIELHPFQFPNLTLQLPAPNPCVDSFKSQTSTRLQMFTLLEVNPWSSRLELLEASSNKVNLTRSLLCPNRFKSLNFRLWRHSKIKKVKSNSNLKSSSWIWISRYFSS